MKSLKLFFQIVLVVGIVVFLLAYRSAGDCQVFCFNPTLVSLFLSGPVVLTGLVGFIIISRREKQSINIQQTNKSTLTIVIISALVIAYLLFAWMMIAQ